MKRQKNLDFTGVLRTLLRGLKGQEVSCGHIEDMTSLILKNHNSDGGTTVERLQKDKRVCYFNCLNPYAF